MIVSNKAIQRIAQLLATARTEPRTQQPVEGKSKVDEVTLSPEGRELQALQRRLAETPDVRREKIEALRAAIAKGEYHVSAEKIAERIIAEHRLSE